MLKSIQDQINNNRRILRDLPTFCNFAEVWVPETLDYRLACVFEAIDHGQEIQER